MTTSSSEIGVTTQPRRIRYFGLPDKCWCGAKLVTKTSKMGPNPYRRYFKCAFADSNLVFSKCAFADSKYPYRPYFKCAFADSNLVDEEEHILKWIDEGLIEEVESNSLLEAEERRLITVEINKIKSACEANSIEEAEYCRLIMDNINETKTVCESKFAELRREIKDNNFAIEAKFGILRCEVSIHFNILMALLFLFGVLLIFFLKNIV